MASDDAPAQVTPDEQLARFIVYSKWVRKDNTVRPEAFIPAPYTELSVTRHYNLSDQEIWELGIAVAQMRNRTLHGRADILAISCTELGLSITPSEPPKNHANIHDWPLSEEEQKIIAATIASTANFKRQ